MESIQTKNQQNYQQSLINMHTHILSDISWIVAYQSLWLKIISTFVTFSEILKQVEFHNNTVLKL